MNINPNGLKVSKYYILQLKKYPELIFQHRIDFLVNHRNRTPTFSACCRAAITSYSMESMRSITELDNVIDQSASNGIICYSLHSINLIFYSCRILISYDITASLEDLIKNHKRI